MVGFDGIPEGTQLPRPIVEYYFKDDKLQLPLESDSDVVLQDIVVDAKSGATGAGRKAVTPEEMELSRRRAENLRLKRENEIELKGPTAVRAWCASCGREASRRARHGLNG